MENDMETGVHGPGLLLRSLNYATMIGVYIYIEKIIRFPQYNIVTETKFLNSNPVNGIGGVSHKPCRPCRWTGFLQILGWQMYALYSVR